MIDFTQITELSIGNDEIVDLCSSNDVVWSQEKGIVIESSSGKSYDYSHIEMNGDRNVLSYKKDMGSNVNIPFSKNSDIGNSDNLIGINITNSNIQRIQDYGFSNCSNIKTIAIPNVLSIGTLSFQNCPSITDFNVQNLKKIGGGSFAYCENLTYITIPSGNSNFNSINERIEIEDEKYIDITKILIDKNAKSIIWANCNYIDEIESMESYSVNYIGDYAFCNNNTISYIKCNYIRGIGNYAFSLCKNLKQLDFGNVKFDSIPLVCNNSFMSCQNQVTCIVPDDNYNKWIIQEQWDRLISMNSVKIIKHTEFIGNFKGTIRFKGLIGDKTYSNKVCTYNGNSWNLSMSKPWWWKWTESDKTVYVTIKNTDELFTNFSYSVEHAGNIKEGKCTISSGSIQFTAKFGSYSCICNFTLG